MRYVHIIFLYEIMCKANAWSRNIVFFFFIVDDSFFISIVGNFIIDTVLSLMLARENTDE